MEIEKTVAKMPKWTSGNNRQKYEQAKILKKQGYTREQAAAHLGISLAELHKIIANRGADEQVVAVNAAQVMEILNNLPGEPSDNPMSFYNLTRKRMGFDEMDKMEYGEDYTNLGNGVIKLKNGEEAEMPRYDSWIIRDFDEINQSLNRGYLQKGAPYLLPTKEEMESYTEEQRDIIKAKLLRIKLNAPVKRQDMKNRSYDEVMNDISKRGLAAEPTEWEKIGFTPKELEVCQSRLNYIKNSQRKKG